VPVKITDNGDGTFPVNYTPVLAGRHKANIKRKGQPVSGAPFTINVDAAKTISANSTASGRGVEPQGVYIEEEAPFVIQARNRIGNPVDRGGEKFEVKVSGPHKHNPSSHVNDANDGTYPSTYTPLLVGDYSVEITLGGTHIKDSPFSVHVSRNPSTIDPAKVKAFGAGLEEANTAEPAIFTIQAFNGRGEPLKKGGDRLFVEIEDPSHKKLQHQFADNNDGTYTVTYQPNDIGDHTVTIALRQAIPDAPPDLVANSPLTVNVIPGTDASKSILFGPGLGVDSVVYDTIPTSFTIQANDKYGNKIPTGGDPFEVYCQDEQGNQVPVDIKDNQDGTYDCKYAPVNAGRHKLGAKLRGKQVGASPYSVEVHEGATEASFVERYSFLIRTKTKKGAFKTVGGDIFNVTVVGPGGQNIKDVKVEDLGNGVHNVSYSVPLEGEYKIYVKINGRHIAGSPWRQTHYSE